MTEGVTKTIGLFSPVSSTPASDTLPNSVASGVALMAMLLEDRAGNGKRKVEKGGTDAKCCYVCASSLDESLQVEARVEVKVLARNK